MPDDRRDYSNLLAQMKDMIDPINKKTDRIIQALYGNGDSERGLIARVAVNTNCRENTQKRWTAIIGGVVVSMLSAIGSLILFLLHKS